jgi:outer membrane protein TolC
MSTLRASNEAIYAQEGKYFPLVEGNFNPTRQRTSAALAPIPSSNATVSSLHTAQLQVSYTFDVWGLNRRTVESLQATADNQRFQVEAAYLTLTSNVAVATITEASLRGQIDAAMQIITLNRRALDVLKHQLETGYASRSDVAAQEAALAQVEATLPPLRKQLQQNRDLLTALLGNYAGQQEPRETFKLEDFTLPVDLPLSLPQS